jgi:hypothetical protein
VHFYGEHTLTWVPPTNVVACAPLPPSLASCLGHDTMPAAPAAPATTTHANANTVNPPAADVTAETSHSRLASLAALSDTQPPISPATAVSSGATAVVADSMLQLDSPMPALHASKMTSKAAPDSRELANIMSSDQIKANHVQRLTELRRWGRKMDRWETFKGQVVICARFAYQCLACCAV